MSDPSLKPGDALLSPIYILSLAIMIVNDHYWKGIGPAWLTGKLSDVAILIMGPLTIQAFFELLLSHFRDNWGPSRSFLIFLSLTMSIIMITINLWDTPATLYRWGMGTLQWPFFTLQSLWQKGTIIEIRPVQLFMDPSDCWTAPCSLVAMYVGWHRHPQNDSLQQPS